MMILKSSLEADSLLTSPSLLPPFVPPPPASQVRNTLRVRRTFWRNEEEEAKADYPGPVDAADSDWSLMDSTDAVGNSCKARKIKLHPCQHAGSCCCDGDVMMMRMQERMAPVVDSLAPSSPPPPIAGPVFLFPLSAQPAAAPPQQLLP